MGELPPRARRILFSKGFFQLLLGTTSACAENTSRNTHHEAMKRNYLRVRGEYLALATALYTRSELPPRARRIPISTLLPINYLGTTSACAENTLLSPRRRYLAWNYLRVRGEYTVFTVGISPPLELPPRARRILTAAFGSALLIGTTSACAENTGQTPCPCMRARNYLRVRGEYMETLCKEPSVTELPPRARRILLLTLPCAIPKGTTSACAENTCMPSSHVLALWNYLRVRGEYPCLCFGLLFTRELPPRARRILYALGTR